jgi:FkbM family methyltransferase
MPMILDWLKASLPNRWKRSVKRSLGFHDMESRLANLRRAGFACTGAVDVGAYAGEWALSAHQCFGCTVIAVEPQPGQRDALETMGGRIPLRVETIALSDRPGVMRFRLEETNSRLTLASEAADPSLIEVSVDRLDEMLSRYPAIIPNLLKADVQGFELQVLDGAGDRLGQFEVVILEVSIIRIGPVPTFSEVIDYMGRRGYRLYDFLSMYYRPLDGALWQGDAFFVRNDSKLVASLEWERS